MRNNGGFSVMVAILITAFLVILSAGILGLIVQESKNTRLVFNTISTFAGAEGATEYALLKIKNHTEGFQDEVKSDDYDNNLLVKDPSSLTNKDAKMEYLISNNSKDYSGSMNGGDFEIIPLFFDSGSLMQTNSKNPNSETSDIKKTLSFSLEGDGGFVRNIIGNDSSGVSIGIVGTGTTCKIIGTFPSVTESGGWLKQIIGDSDVGTDIKKVTLSSKKISDFLSENEDSYLIIYSSGNLNYKIKSNEGFTLPKLKIVGSASIGNFRQNIEIEESKNKYFDALKYSLFSK